MNVSPLLDTHIWIWWMSGIVAEMNRLPATFHRDPADRLIVATARFSFFTSG